MRHQTPSMAKKCRGRGFAHECHVIRRSISPVTPPVLTALGGTGGRAEAPIVHPEPRPAASWSGATAGCRATSWCARAGAPPSGSSPRVTSSRGRRTRRRRGAARCGGRRPACTPGPWWPSPRGSRPSVRRTRLYDAERTRFRHRRRRGRRSRVRSKADGSPTASGLSGAGQIARGGGARAPRGPPRPQSGAGRHSGEQTRTCEGPPTLSSAKRRSDPGPCSGPQRPPSHAKHVGGDEGVGGHVGIDGVTDLPPTIERHRVRHSRQRPRDPAAVEEAKGHR